MSTETTDPLILTEKLGRAPCEHCGELLDVSDFHVFENIECPACGKSTTVPGKLGNFDLLRELGRGGMGAVFLARDAHLRRKVALKVLNAKFGRDPVFVDSLLREAKAAAALNHRNIVHIFSYGQVNHQPYIVMELVDGIRLDQCINPGQEQEEEGWLGILEQVARGLAAAEAARVIHGDIKPANILLDERGLAKVSDFGIARFQGGDSDRILGTPLYIAPEKVRGLPVDARADQYSLGATFWHILSGRPPFTGNTPREVIVQRFEIPPPDLRAHAPHISPETGALLQRMMAIDPMERFPDFNTLAAAAARIPALLAERHKQEEDRLRDMEIEAARLLRKRLQLRWLITAGCIAIAVVALLIYREMR